MHARLARYGYSGDAHDLARRAEDGLLPIYQAQPGFRALSIAVTAEEVFSFTVWDEPGQIDAANAAAADWVAANMADELSLREIVVAEILISTAMGVSTAG